MSTTETNSTTTDRRSFLRVGGLAAVTAAALAACGGKNNGAGPEVIPQSGTAPALQKDAAYSISDALLLRTATSLHHNTVALFSALDKAGALGAVKDAATAYSSVLAAQASALADATTKAGATPYEKANPAVDESYVQPALVLVNASDTKADDGARLAQAFVALLATTHQAFVALASQPALRQLLMQIGTVHSAAAGAMAGLISPDNIVPQAAIESANVNATTTAAAAETTAASGDAQPVLAAVDVYVIPSAFGTLSAVPVVLGNSTSTDAATKRQQLAFDSPSYNSFIRDGES